MQKVEYVDEMQEMQQRKISGRNECMDDMQRLLQIAQQLGHIKCGCTSAQRHHRPVCAGGWYQIQLALGSASL